MEKPMLFSTPMVQALLNGTKSQTRRTAGLNAINQYPDEWQAQVRGVVDGKDLETYQYTTPRESFKSLWQSINGKPKPVRKDGTLIACEAYPFDASCALPHTHWQHVSLYQYVNPWVWVIRFKEVSGA